MSKLKKITITGILQKKDNQWVAHLPAINLSSKGENPSLCLENLIQSIKTLMKQEIELRSEVNDEFVVNIFSFEVEKFLTFINDRVANNINHKIIMGNLKDYILEEN